jgi:DNA-binding transcriptional LysR family regulator
VVAKGERGRLVIRNIGLLTHTFLPAALAAFRELFPLVEATVTNSHAQAEALLDGSIMLRIGYLDAGVDEEDRQLLATQLLLQSPFASFIQSIDVLLNTGRQGSWTFATAPS